MASPQYFSFIGSFWDNLPVEDQKRMGEYWKGCEQVFAAAYQNFVEVDLNISINKLQSYRSERWLSYTFNSSNDLNRPAVYTSTQDMSATVNLATHYLLRFSINNGPQIEVDLRGNIPITTTIDEIIARINAGAGFSFATGIFQNTIIQLASNISGPTSSIKIFPASNLSADAAEFVLGLDITSGPLTFPEFPYAYSLQYPSIAQIPTLQNHIRDESTTLSMDSGSAYEIQTGGVIAFKSAPPEILWARKTLFDNEDPWYNFGFLMNIYQRNTPSYLSVVQGLWFAYWSGAKPYNIQTSLYLLFGLPTAKEDAVVTGLTPTIIQTTSKAGYIRVFQIPTSLVATVNLGDSVKQYQPLVSGIEVFDKVNKPGFVTTEIGRAGIQRFLTEDASRGTGDTDETKALRMLEEHTFLPQISVEAFISPDINLGNVKTFLNSIRPLTTTFMFQVIVGVFKDELVMDDSIGMDVALDVTPNVDSNQTTRLDAATLLNYETVDMDGMNLDSDGVCFQETLEVTVFQNSIQIDDFFA